MWTRSNRIINLTGQREAVCEDARPPFHQEALDVLEPSETLCR